MPRRALCAAFMPPIVRPRLCPVVHSAVHASTRSVRRSILRVQGKTVHGVQQTPRHLRHLIGGRRQLGRSGGGCLHQFPHPLHCHHHRLRSRSLFFHRRIDFVGYFIQPGRGSRDLRGAVRLLVGRRPNFLRELVNLRHHV